MKIKVLDKKRNSRNTKYKAYTKHDKHSAAPELQEELIMLRRKEEVIDSLLHELRSINSDLKDCLDEIDFKTADRQVIDIWAQANLLSIRMRMYDFEINSNVLGKSIGYDIPIFKRVEKVYKCLDRAHFKKHVSIVLSGKSFQTFEGSDEIEIAFYIIIHNAIKYAPTNSTINIQFIEIGDSIIVEFSNKGVLPLKDEIEKLTDRGYRGSNAISKQIHGSGIGLYTLKKICTSQGVNLNISTVIDTPMENIGTFKVILKFTGCKQPN